jgi:maltose/maltodextrin transport system substrate-binding protein
MEGEGLVNRAFYDSELEQYGIPIRPGEPGKAPFWNGYSTKFSFAPAFELPLVAGAGAYRFTAIAGDGQIHTFEADVPWAPLTPIWAELPEGMVKLKVEGVAQPGGVALGNAGEKAFYRSPVFNGPYRDPAPISYEEAGKNGLRALLKQRKFQYWLQEGKPDPECRLYCYPAKEMGAALRGMSAYSKITADPQESREAIQIALLMADFLIETSIPAGQPLEHMPLIYWLNPDSQIIEHVKTAASRVTTMMMSEPTRAAFGFLDLYDATGEKRLLEAAVRMARTFVKIQRADGTWPLVVNRETGEEIESKPVIPTWILFFLDRLSAQYGFTEFDPVRRQVEQWIMEHPVKNFHWDAQFEDIKIKAPYEKMSYEQAADMAGYLFDHAHDNPERIRLAEEILRFVEDQFVVWEHPTQGWKELGLAGSVPGKYPTRLVENWITPAVIEQYGFFIVARATAFVMRAYGKAYEATGKEVYLAKARSLANTLVASQQHHGGGEIPTFPMTTVNFYWTNNSVYTALYLLELDGIMGSQG